MKNTNIEVAIRKIKNDDKEFYKLQIREQYSRNIRFTSDSMSYALRTETSPQSTSNIFYLRGNNTDADLTWIDLQEKCITKIVTILSEYADGMGFDIFNELTSDGKEIVISLSNPKNYIRTEINILTTTNCITMLEISDEKN